MQLSAASAKLVTLSQARFYPSQWVERKRPGPLPWDEPGRFSSRAHQNSDPWVPAAGSASGMSPGTICQAHRPLLVYPTCLNPAMR